MTRYACEFDGKSVTYRFGKEKIWSIAATSLARAVRAFRVGALHPHQYSTARVQTRGVSDTGSTDYLYLSSEPGGVVPVRVGSQHVADIAPEGDEAADYQLGVLPTEVVGSLSDSTSLQVAGTATGLDVAARCEIEARTRALTEKMGQLAQMRHELMRQRQELEAEVARRVEQIWLIELFLGTKEEVHVLREGEPALASTRITVRQQVLCMDEEIAVYDWVHDLDRDGGFDYRDLEAFDRWLLDDAGHLNAVLPEPKGIAAFRVRRWIKDRPNHDFVAGTR